LIPAGQPRRPTAAAAALALEARQLTSASLVNPTRRRRDDRDRKMINCSPSAGASVRLHLPRNATAKNFAILDNCAQFS
jgi:hypothetical protein